MNRLRFLTALLCLLLLSPLAADAQKKKKGGKKKENQEQPTPSQDQQQPPAASPAPPPAEVGTVDRRLWEYKTSEARSALNSVAGQADSNAAVAVAMGRVLEQEKNYGESESRLRKATEMSPSDPAAWVWLGETYLRQHNSGAADSAFRKAAEVAGGNDYYLGVARQRLRQYDEAVAAFERAQGFGALVPYQIGVTRLFQEQWQPALDQLTRAIDSDSGLAYAYYYRGLAAEKLNRKDLLVNDMERFLKIAPDSPEAERARMILRAVKK
ncbi:MAG: Anaphase-promoting complex, cyclosome, subunit 3 [Acidobacteriota bacterium]|jgi:tetratricopeptide (TPR) repeat protein|nr:Anaphase-promoting complex, cyclosome, subunit 3 [Acidobacteriota bacterium]